MKRCKYRTLAARLFSWPAFSLAAPFCHLHAPGSSQNKDDPSQWLQIYENQKNNYKACEQDNIRRFSGQGRCHCSFSKLPGYRLPPNKNAPMDPGEGISDQIP